MPLTYADVRLAGAEAVHIRGSAIGVLTLGWVLRRPDRQARSGRLLRQTAAK